MSDRQLRHFCRNKNCRTKLEVPTDNHHKAFCKPFCHATFYNWKCKVCEKPILKGRRRKQPDHCHAKACRKAFRTYPEAFGYPYSPTLNYGSRSAHFTGVKSALDGPFRDWQWDDTRAIGEHWLYCRDRVVAIVVEVAEDDYRIPYPYTYPVQTATTLEAARKLALHVALWTWPIGGLKPKPEPRDKITEAEWLEREAHDAKLEAEDRVLPR